MDYSWIGMTRSQMSDENMMRSNNIMKWSGKSQFKSATGTTSPWIHPPGALQGAHVAYLVKFLGCTEVDQAKGMEVIKAGIRKMRFNSHVKRSEGSKIPKVELTISIDGVAIQDPKTKKILHQYPLYRISFCADDKAEKRFFCFIAKEDNVSAEHRCFVFVSDRLAENITLTIGQAFDLAYRRYLETSGRDLEMRKQLLILQKRTKLLEQENSNLRSRVAELEGVGYDRSVANGGSSGTNSRAESLEDSTLPVTNGHGLIHHNGIVFGAPHAETFSHSTGGYTNGHHETSRLQPPPLPPRPKEGLPPALNGAPADLIILDPYAVTMTAEEDPFGDFHKLFTGPGVNQSGGSNSSNSTAQLDDAILRVDKRMLEMKEGFTRGLVFGKDDFSLDAFDPLAKNSDTSHA
ncbi:PTB domain-containing engulfment adapter protein 1 [Hypsibius exemplaris]|uniref:PTB domain-containing engulfment adapter protein 1 n=1 Tax=Hypsibius exemplaris TaxID=2072580 RepID=A0A1W0WK22_HYPEX|nr:PTB domain-containing engulfment adapter protein 1 [Hypsibius exemplaris]